MKFMTKKIKQIDRIKANQKDVKFSDLVSLLEEFEFELTRVKGSHHVFNRDDVTFVVPVHKNRVKEVYVKRVLSLIKKFES